jgi:hypothetical protein
MPGRDAKHTNLLWMSIIPGATSPFPHILLITQFIIMRDIA